MVSVTDLTQLRIILVPPPQGFYFDGEESVNVAQPAQVATPSFSLLPPTDSREAAPIMDDVVNPQDMGHAFED